MGQVSSSLGAKKGAKQSQARQSDTYEAIRKQGGPAWLNDWMAQVYPQLQNMYEGDRVTAADQLAAEEHDTLGAIDALAARHGLYGSGAHLMARANARGGRQAGLDQAMVDKYMKALGLVSQQGQGMQGALVSGIAGLPQPQGVPQNPYASMLQPGANALGYYLMNRGGNQPLGQPSYSSLGGYQAPAYNPMGPNMYQSYYNPGFNWGL